MEPLFTALLVFPRNDTVLHTILANRIYNNTAGKIINNDYESN